MMTAIGGHTYAQITHDYFSEINSLLFQKSYLKAEELYKTHRKELSNVYRNYTEMCLNNAFNKLEASEEAAHKIISGKKQIEDSLMVHLWEIKKDNAVKLYHYKEAANACDYLLKTYSNSLNEKQKKDLQNDWLLWHALQHIPAQEILIKDNTTVRIFQDKAGLKNLNVSTEIDSLHFIFDTGANISTISNSAATKMGMKIIPGNIKVEAITGKEVETHLAVCDKLSLGNIEISHAVFLVFEDADLSFPQIGYQINGILGFPVIEAMKEITLTKDGYFSVPKKDRTKPVATNMALNELIPLIFIDNNPYTFDTGADKTILYKPYFLSKRQSITDQYQLDSISFGGAGGGHKFAGYKINTTFKIADKAVSLKGISLLIDDVEKEAGIYGNVGQDVIKEFNSMTINFEKMFIRFD